MPQLLAHTALSLARAELKGEGAGTSVGMERGQEKTSGSKISKVPPQKLWMFVCVFFVMDFVT